MGSQFVTVAVIIITWISSGLITLGIMKSKMSEYERRIDALERGSDQIVRRGEYDERHAENRRRLEAIEFKLDKLTDRLIRGSR